MLQTHAQGLQLLPAVVQALRRTDRLKPEQGGVIALRGRLQTVPHGIVQFLGQYTQATLQLTGIRREQFGGDRGRRCAQVRGEIEQTEIHLMANGRDHRNRGAGHHAHQCFVVERPQVFQ